MSTELVSLLELTLPIIFFAILYTCYILYKYGKKDFKIIFLNAVFSESKVLLYILSLYYISLLFDNIHADAVMEWGLKIIVVLCWLVWVIKNSVKEE